MKVNVLIILVAMSAFIMLVMDELSSVSINAVVPCLHQPSVKQLMFHLILPFRISSHSCPLIFYFIVLPASPLQQTSRHNQHDR